MTQKTTSSKDWVYLTKYYSIFKINFRVKNMSFNTAKIQFRSIYRSEIELMANQCSDQSATVYAEVWIKSPNGEPVTVSSF